ncbi:MAG: BatD family protein [Xanthomonadaceae bacterium]|nr:BatD family protein [Xanthomonadaceae bacterium]
MIARTVRVPVLRAFAALWLCVALMAGPAAAESRAFIDRDRLALDDTLTMTVQVEDDALLDLPDFSQLIANFRIEDIKTDQQLIMGPGRMGLRMSLFLTLRPKREGRIDIPPFRVGNQMLGPFVVTVLPPRNPQPVAPPPPLPSAQSNDRGMATLQTSIEPGPAYAQQAVGYVVRLYYDQTRMIDGKLDQATPPGATLMQLGEDVESNLVVDSRPYRLVERRFLLIPDRPGLLRIPSPIFEGRGVVSMFDEMFGNASRGTMKIAGESRSVQVRPIPANAPQPWLPARSVSLRYLAVERSPRVGEAAKVIVEMSVDGANAVMLPELKLDAVGAAQVFPEPPQVDESFFENRPRATVAREFSIVPEKTGKLHIAGPRVAWWDVKQGVARTASLPDFMWDVAPAANATGQAAQVGGAVGEATKGERFGQGLFKRFDRATLGIAAASMLALMWAATLVWAWRLWKGRRRARPNASSAAPVARGYDAFAYKRLLDNGSLAEIADALCAMASPVAKDLDRLRAMLDDPMQRAAIDALQRARWRDGSVAETRAQLRAAFADGPRWRPQRRATALTILPPLYPET